MVGVGGGNSRHGETGHDLKFKLEETTSHDVQTHTNTHKHTHTHTRTCAVDKPATRGVSELDRQVGHSREHCPFFDPKAGRPTTPLARKRLSSGM